MQSNPDITIVLQKDAPDPQVANWIKSFLFQHDRAQVGGKDPIPLCLLGHDASGVLIGGLLGETYLGYLFVEILALSPDVRGGGIGSRLLQEAEEEAIQRGCHTIFLETFGFQARPFYEKHGYSLFGNLAGVSDAQRLYFLHKTLASTSHDTPIADEAR